MLAMLIIVTNNAGSALFLYKSSQLIGKNGFSIACM